MNPLLFRPVLRVVHISAQTRFDVGVEQKAGRPW